MARLPAHLQRDLRLLGHALGAAAEVQAVEARVSQHAQQLMATLCSEIRQETSQAQASLPQLELFASPVALNSKTLGVRTLVETPPGQLMSFYPGVLMDADEPRLPKSDKLFANEYGGMYLNGKGWLPAHWRGHPLLAEQSRAIWHGNRLAAGNLLNHAPSGKLPNCVPAPFRWPTWQALRESSPAIWARLLPHVFMREGKVAMTPSGRKDVASKEGAAAFPPWPFMGIAFVSVRGLAAGEELFWNYRIHPRPDAAGKDVYPSWYSPVDEDAFEAAVLGS
eukprot:TRINITY_DN61578_c0_g1_i1.p1 TRINITY_DN61578_c0_g1~~TRINITY_DN61578_c0_g1_i1.p1  ORF type:complete len:280 (-),score=53.67 TRINITY_DN61578_c0_g1_i1:61-900(-)